MRESQCPSCGAPLIFKNAHSLYAVCRYCATFSVQAGDALKEVGKAAVLNEDGSPLQIGAVGYIPGVSGQTETRFEIVGRIQLDFGAGSWNEWYLDVDGQKEGMWLGEANGFYYLMQLVDTKSIKMQYMVLTDEKYKINDGLPGFSEAKLKDTIYLNNEKYYVKDIQQGTVVSGEGELPFEFHGGYDAPVIDCFSSNGKVLTIDYSEKPPMVFAGQVFEFKDLKFNKLRPVYGWSKYTNE